MQLGIVLLFCLFIACATRAAQTPFALMGLNIGSVAALSLALLAANAFPVQLIPEIWINPGALLLCICAGVFTVKREGNICMLIAVGCALIASICMLIGYRLTAQMHLLEPGIVLAFIGLPLYMLLRNTPAAALFTAALAPLLFNFCATGLELYLYGYAVLDLGSTAAFDAQLMGIILAGALISLLGYRNVRRARNV